MDLITLIKTWCDRNGINFSEIIPDNKMTTLRISIADPKLLRLMIKGAVGEIPDNKLIRLKKNRNDTQVTVSDISINDSISRRENMNYKDKLDNAFGDLSEEQIRFSKSPTRRSTRSQRRPKKRVTSESQYKTYVSPTQSLKHKSRLSKDEEGKKEQSDEKNDFFKEIIARKTSETKPDSNDGLFQKSSAIFRLKLVEALEGMATATEQQPNDLIAKFDQALAAAGNIEQMLNDKGIFKAISKDGQAIIIYNINQQTKAKQPMMRIPIEGLAEKSKFEEAITNCIDYANDNAPGAMKQREEQMNKVKQKIREIASQYGPEPAVDSESANVGQNIARNA